MLPLESYIPREVEEFVLVSILVLTPYVATLDALRSAICLRLNMDSQTLSLGQETATEIGKYL